MCVCMCGVYAMPCVGVRGHRSGGVFLITPYLLLQNLESSSALGLTLTCESAAEWGWVGHVFLITGPIIQHEESQKDF